MIPVRIYRVLIVLLGISMLLVGVDTALASLGLSGAPLKVTTGLFAGFVVSLMALEGGRTLRFCAKGLDKNAATSARVSEILKDVGCNDLGLRASVVNSSRVFAISVSEGRSHRIFISSKLLNEFSQEGRIGVLTHECGHILNKQPTKQAVLLGLVAGVKMSLGIPWISAVVILLAYLWMLREWEFVADARAVVLGGQNALRRAFLDYQEVSGDKKDAALYSELLSGHPSIARRLRRIGGSYA